MLKRIDSAITLSVSFVNHMFASDIDNVIVFFDFKSKSILDNLSIIGGGAINLCVSHHSVKVLKTSS